MIITVFGATGMVGSHIVKLGLHMGHTIRAYSRNVFAEKMPENPQLHLIAGALFDDSSLYKAIKGADTVLSALGGAFNGSDQTRSLGMKHIISQMEKAEVNRIVTLGGKGLLDVSEEDSNLGLIMDQPGFPEQFMPVSLEHLKAYRYLQASSLQWTMIGSPDIHEGEVTGKYLCRTNVPPVPDNNRIFAGDLAMLMLNELDRNEFVRQKVGVSAV